jgi:hypothetical protein
VSEPERVDFAKLIADLEAAGITLYKISLMVHRHFKQVQRWKNGSEPKHYEGEMLRLIHREFVVPRET